MITALLGRWLTADDVASASTSAVGEVLERLIVATQVRYPVIGDIARNLRFRLFDEPQIRKAREQIYDGVREGLQYLADNPDAPDYAARIDALVATPELLIDLLAQRISDPARCWRWSRGSTTRSARSKTSRRSNRRVAISSPAVTNWPESNCIWFDCDGPRAAVGNAARRRRDRRTLGGQPGRRHLSVLAGRAHRRRRTVAALRMCSPRTPA